MRPRKNSRNEISALKMIFGFDPLVKMAKTVENFGNVIFACSWSKISIFFTVLTRKNDHFFQKCEKIDILIFEFLDHQGGSRGSEQVINPKKQVRRPMEAGKTLFWRNFF